jgi:hypothetical protein
MRSQDQVHGWFVRHNGQAKLLHVDARCSRRRALGRLLKRSAPELEPRSCAVIERDTGVVRHRDRGICPHLAGARICQSGIRIRFSWLGHVIECGALFCAALVSQDYFVSGPVHSSVQTQEKR